MTVRVAAVGDVHVGTDTAGRLREGLADVDGCADLFLLAGDLTRLGTVEEIECLIDEIAVVSVPRVAVLGNHDLHSDEGDAIRGRLADAGVCVLEGSSTVVDVGGVSVGVAGAKGFGGGFVGRSASEFGEPEMKAFVRHTREISDALERSLAELGTDVRIALLHYSPVPDTLAGEPLEIHPFLGSYLLGEAIDRAGADVVFHGHAHRGRERGITPGGVRVRNVAQPVLGRPFAVYALHAADHLEGAHG